MSSLAHPRARALLLWVLRIAAGLFVSACDQGPRVPFKLGDDGPRAAPPAATTALPAVHTPQAASYGSAVDGPMFDGAQLPASGVRATLVHDVDGDEDRDVFALVHDTEKRLRLIIALREGSGFRAPNDIPGFVVPADTSCTVARAALSVPGPDKGLLTVAYACGDERREPPDELFFFSLEAPPRVLTHIEPSSLRDGDTPLRLTVVSEDVDRDGHGDLTLLVGHAPAPGTLGEPIRLTWIDRASGLARDLREPEATLAAFAKRAEGDLPTAPALAEQRAAEALSLFDAVCAEADAPRMRVAGTVGVSCGVSASRMRLLATLVLARAKQKKLREALDAYRTFVAGAQTRDARSHDKLKVALRKLASKSARLLRVGPQVAAAHAPGVHLPSARFVDEDTLLLRRSAPVTLRLSAGEETPTNTPFDDLVRDPAGVLAVTQSERVCQGHALRIDRAPETGAPSAARERLGSVLAVPNGRSEADCAGRSVSPARPSDLRVIGWAPQGIVGTRAGEVWVVPLTAAGTVLGAPFALAPDAPRPAPLTTGLSTRDGAQFAELLPVGIAIFGADARHVELLSPAGFAEVAASASDVALSPSGRRVAVVAGDTLYVIER